PSPRREVLALEKDPEGSQEDLEIKPQSDVVHVPDVALELLVPVEAVASVDLGPARQTGPHFMTACLRWVVAFEVLHQQRSWPHEAHVAAQDVVKLGQFIQAGAA